MAEARYQLSGPKDSGEEAEARLFIRAFTRMIYIPSAGFSVPLFSVRIPGNPALAEYPVNFGNFALAMVAMSNTYVILATLNPYDLAMLAKSMAEAFLEYLELELGGLRLIRDVSDATSEPVGEEKVAPAPFDNSFVSNLIMRVDYMLQSIPRAVRIDARQCLKYAICRANNHPKRYGALGRILRVIYPPNLAHELRDKLKGMRGSHEEHIIYSYANAALLGKINQDNPDGDLCSLKYSETCWLL